MQPCADLSGAPSTLLTARFCRLALADIVGRPVAPETLLVAGADYLIVAADATHPVRQPAADSYPAKARMALPASTYPVIVHNGGRLLLLLCRLATPCGAGGLEKTAGVLPLWRRCYCCIGGTTGSPVTARYSWFPVPQLPRT